MIKFKKDVNTYSPVHISDVACMPSDYLVDPDVEVIDYTDGFEVTFEVSCCYPTHTHTRHTQ